MDTYNKPVWIWNRMNGSKELKPHKLLMSVYHYPKQKEAQDLIKPAHKRRTEAMWGRGFFLSLLSKSQKRQGWGLGMEMEFPIQDIW